jgi:hypothetical protein
MKKIALVALCAAGALSLFFTYRKVYAVVIEATLAPRPATITIVNQTPDAQIITLMLKNGTTATGKVAANQTTTMQSADQIVQIQSQKDVGTQRIFVTPQAIEVDDFLKFRSLTATIFSTGGIDVVETPGQVITSDMLPLRF